MALRGALERGFTIQIPLREGFGVEVRILLVEDNAEFGQAFARALGLALVAERLDVTFVESGTRCPRPASGCRRVGWTPR